jgi:hypothetical protein
MARPLEHATFADLRLVPKQLALPGRVSDQEVIVAERGPSQPEYLSRSHRTKGANVEDRAVAGGVLSTAFKTYGNSTDSSTGLCGSLVFGYENTRSTIRIPMRPLLLQLSTRLLKG